MIWIRIITEAQDLASYLYYDDRRYDLLVRKAGHFRFSYPPAKNLTFNLQKPPPPPQPQLINLIPTPKYLSLPTNTSPPPLLPPPTPPPPSPHNKPPSKPPHLRLHHPGHTTPPHHPSPVSPPFPPPPLDPA